MWSNPTFVFHPGKMGSGKTPLYALGEGGASQQADHPEHSPEPGEGSVTGKVTLQKLGNGSERTAVRNLLNTWLAYGWTDRCHAALAIVEAVAASDSGLTPKQAAAKVPSDFLAANNINRATVADSLLRWSS